MVRSMRKGATSVGGPDTFVGDLLARKYPILELRARCSPCWLCWGNSQSLALID